MVFPHAAWQFLRSAALCLSLVAAGLLVPHHLSGQGPEERAPEPAGPGAAEPDLVAEARSFMAAYAEDLRRGDRAAVAARYDPAGVHEMRPGIARRTTYDAIATRYATDWQPPAGFEWRDLDFEVVGPDAIVVTGLFAWTSSDGERADVQSYVALLRRHPEGGLRIRLEAEAGQPRVPFAVLGAAAGVVAVLAFAVGWFVGRRRPAGVSTSKQRGSHV